MFSVAAGKGAGLLFFEKSFQRKILPRSEVPKDQGGRPAEVFECPESSEVEGDEDEENGRSQTEINKQPKNQDAKKTLQKPDTEKTGKTRNGNFLR